MCVNVHSVLNLIDADDDEDDDAGHGILFCHRTSDAVLGTLDVKIRR